MQTNMDDLYGDYSFSNTLNKYSFVLFYLFIFAFPQRDDPYFSCDHIKKKVEIQSWVNWGLSRAPSEKELPQTNQLINSETTASLSEISCLQQHSMNSCFVQTPKY